MGRLATLHAAADVLISTYIPQRRRRLLPRYAPRPPHSSRMTDDRLLLLHRPAFVLPVMYLPLIRLWCDPARPQPQIPSLVFNIRLSDPVLTAPISCNSSPEPIARYRPVWSRPAVCFVMRRVLDIWEMVVGGGGEENRLVVRPVFCVRFELTG